MAKTQKERDDKYRKKQEELGFVRKSIWVKSKYIQEVMNFIREINKKD